MPRGGANGPRCQKHCKNGTPCKAAALKDRTYCRMHGGTRGGRPPVTGEHSRHFPKHMLDDLNAALDNPGLLSLNFEIAAVESRMSELQRGVEQGLPHAAAWLKARELYDDATSGSGTQAQSMEKLGGLLEKQGDAHRCWEEWALLAELRRKLAHTEVLKQEKLDQFMSKKEAAALGAALMHVLRKYVPDANQRDMAIVEVASLMNRRRALPAGA